MDPGRQIVTSFARSASTAEGPRRLAELVVAHLSRCTAASLSLRTPRGSLLCAASVGATAEAFVRAGVDPTYLEIDRLVVSTDVRSDRRWPGLGEILEGGDGAALIAVPVACSGDRSALLTLHGAAGRTWRSEDIAVAEAIGALAGTVLCAAHEVVNLRAALASRELVGQAVGILVERRRVSPGEAFALLSRTSQDGNRKLRDVAIEVVETGVDPTTDAVGPAPGLAVSDRVLVAGPRSRRR